MNQNFGELFSIARLLRARERRARYASAPLPLREDRTSVRGPPTAPRTHRGQARSTAWLDLEFASSCRLTFLKKFIRSDFLPTILPPPKTPRRGQEGLLPRAGASGSSRFGGAGSFLLHVGVHRALKCWSGAGGRRSPSFFAIASELGSEPAGGASGATHHGPAPPAAADTRHKAAARARSETSPTADCWLGGRAY